MGQNKPICTDTEHCGLVGMRFAHQAKGWGFDCWGCVGLSLNLRRSFVQVMRVAYRNSLSLGNHRKVRLKKLPPKQINVYHSFPIILFFITPSCKIKGIQHFNTTKNVWRPLSEYNNYVQSIWVRRGRRLWSQLPPKSRNVTCYLFVSSSSK